MTRQEMKRIFNEYSNLKVGDIMELNRASSPGKIGIITSIEHYSEDGEEWEEYALQVDNDEILINSSEAFAFFPQIKIIEKT